MPSPNKSRNKLSSIKTLVPLNRNNGYKLTIDNKSNRPVILSPIILSPRLLPDSMPSQERSILNQIKIDPHEIVLPKTKVIKEKEPWNNDVWIHKENKDRHKIIKSKNGNDDPIFSKPNSDIRSRAIMTKNLKL